MAADAGTAIFRAIADFSRLRKESQKTAAELRKLKDEAEDTGAGLELVDEAADRSENSLGRFAKAAARARRDLEGLGDAAVDAGAGMELAAKAADDLSDELDDVAKSAKRAERALKGLGNEAVATAAKLEAASLASESLGDRMGKSFDGASERGSKLRAVLASLADVQRDLGRNVDTTAGDLGTLSQRFGQLDGAGDNLVRRYTEQGDGLRALSRAGQDAAAAQEVLLRAQEAQADAAGRVRVAEENLAEGRAKAVKTAAQIADLEEKLAASRRKHEAAARATAEAEENVAKAAAKTSAEVEKIATASDRAADAHERHGKAANKASGEFQKLGGDGERTGSGLLKFAAIAGGVVTALGALGGAAGGAVAGFYALLAGVVQISGVLGLLPGVLGAAGLAVTTLKVGLSGFGDVLSAVAEGDLAAFQKAIAGMGPQAQAVAQALWTWSAPLQTIKKDTQEALLNGLAPAVQALGANYLPLVHGALTRVARAFNGVAKSTLDWLNQSGQINTVRGILDNLALALEKAAPGAKNLASAFLTFFRVSSEQMPSLAEGFNQLTARFDAFIQKAAADGSLAQWMNVGRAAAAELFKTLGNLGVILWQVLTVGAEQGRGLFDVLSTITGGMREFVTSAEGVQALSVFFANMHDAAVALMPAIKAAAKTILQDLVPALASIAVDIGPGLADLFDGVGDAINTARPGLDAFSESVGKLLEALGNAGPLVGTVLGGVLRGLGTVAGIAAAAINLLTEAFNNLPAPVQAVIGHAVGLGTTFVALIAGLGLLTGALGAAVAAVRVFAGGLAMIARGGKGSFMTGLSTMFGATGKAARKAQREVGGFGKSVTKTIDPLTREIPLDKKKGKELDTLAGSSKRAAADTKTFTREVAASAPALNTATNAAKKTTAATGELGKAGATAGREYPRTLSEGIKGGAAAAGTAAAGLATDAGAKGKAAAGKAGTDAGREYPKTLQQGLSPNSGGIANAMTEPINTGGRQATTAAGNHGGAAGRGFTSRMAGALRGGAGAITGALGGLLGGLGGAAGRAGTAGNTAGGNFVTRMGTRLRGGAAATSTAATAATAGLGGAAATSAGAAGARVGGGWVSRLGGVLRGAGGVLGVAAGVGLLMMGSTATAEASEQGRLSGEGYIRDASGAVDSGGQILASAGESAWLLMFGKVGAVIAAGKVVYDQDRAAMEYWAQNRDGIMKGATAAFGEEGAKQIESASQTGSGIVTAATASGVGMEQAWKAGWDGTNRVQAEGTAWAMTEYGKHVGGMEGLALQLQGKMLGAVQWIGEKSRSAWDWISGLWGGGSQNAVAAAGTPLVGLGAKIAGPVQEGGTQSQGAWGTVQGIFSAGAGFVSQSWSAFWGMLGTVVSTAWTGVTTAVSTGWTFLQTLWTTATTVISTAWSLFWTGLTTVATLAWTGLQTAISTGWTLLQTLWTTFTTTLSTAWQLFWTTIQTIAQTAWTMIQTGWQAFTTFLSTLWTTLTTTLSTVWQTFWTTIQTVAQTAWEAIKTGLGALRDFFAQVWQTISDTTRTILQTAADAWRTIVDTVTQTIQDILQRIIDFLGGVFSGAWDTASGVVETVAGAIGAAAEGMANAVKSAIDVAVAALDWLVQKAQAAATAIAGALGMGGGGNVAPGPRGMAAGGVVQGMADGGPVEGMASGGATPLRRRPGPVHGSGRQDKHHRLLMSDEFVVNRRDSKRHRGALELINSGRGDEVLPPGMAAGGNVAVRQGSIPDAAWNRLLSMGYRGNPADGMEALYPSKADLATALGSTGGSTASPVSSPAPGGASPVTGAVGAAAGVVGAAGGALTPEQLKAVQAAVAVLVAQLAAWQVRLQTLSATGMVPVVTATLGQVLPALRSLQATLGMSATRTQTTTATVQQADTVRAQSTTTANQAIVASYQQADQTRTTSTQQSTSAISTASQQMASSTSSSASTIDSGANTVVAAAQRVAAATAALGGAGGGGGGAPYGRRYEDGSIQGVRRAGDSPDDFNPDGSIRRDRGGRMARGGWYRNETGRTEYAFTHDQVMGKKRPPVDVSGMLGAAVPSGLSRLDGDYPPVTARPADYGDGDGPRGFTVNQTNNIISPKAETGSAKLQAAGRRVARYGVTALKEAKV